MSDKEKLLAIVNDEIDTYKNMVKDEMERVKRYTDPSLVAISGDSLGKYNYALKTLIDLRAKMEEAQ